MNQDDHSALLHRFAMALHFDDDDGLSPKVSGRARGLLADQMLAIARENDIPVVEDEHLLKGLSFLEVGQKVPEEFYPLLVELVLHIENLSRDLQERASP